MEYLVTQYPELNTLARLSTFTPEGGGIAEHHLMITVSNPKLTFSDQLASVITTLNRVVSTLRTGTVPVFKRWFLSDSANQAFMLPEERDCAVSIVEQPPLNATKVALWVLLQEEMAVTFCETDTAICEARHGAYTHLWHGSASVPDLHSEIATIALLEELDLKLGNRGGSMMGNCVRTWFFVHDVDVNYSGVVTGRNKAFAVAGLTPQTHYIASTGIGGRHADPSVTVQMDSYSIAGLAEGQVSYLRAPDFLNPTYEYGVAFERGTRIAYGDRSHLLISGTASIDNRGEILFPGDICRQTDRMLTNVAALLAEGGCGWDDVAHMIVYLRDPADYHTVNEILTERFPTTPAVIVLAPVCRPGWLIEMECMAIGRNADSRFAPL